MGYALANSANYEEITCGECGIVFYVPGHWQATRRENKQNFYCPNGHCRCYRESEADRLRWQLTAEKQRHEWEKARADSLDKRLKLEAGKHARLKKRLAAGICPCCQRTVSQLAAHMRTKHPEYAVPPPVVTP